MFAGQSGRVAELLIFLVTGKIALSALQLLQHTEFGWTTKIIIKHRPYHGHLIHFPKGEALRWEVVIQTADIPSGGRESNHVVGEGKKGETRCRGKMSSADPSLTKAEEATARQIPEVSAEGNSNYSPRPPPPPLPSPDEKLGMGLCGQCQAWLLSPLDDVRYLISCTNWSEVLSWLPASALYVGIIYSGSRALSRLPIPIFLTLHNAAEILTYGIEAFVQKESEIHKSIPLYACYEMTLQWSNIEKL
ncbi:hypothetical protein JRQ81_012645 [Phrynocephalus forsythii]|uniref:Mitochondrial pyruvate carrier n=1 Tax=Phrynocephalus forsythii TaxID=171643 RepID=A0A9Q0Y276_9SAUR|nr:hypothetical protein JRQ81_012645 [Phrynocephalus forsythii]